MIIGICGKKYHGKNTISDYLVEKYNFREVTFSEPLKECCRILFGFSQEQLFGGKKEEIDPRWNTSPRKALQFFGTDVCRKYITNLLPDIDDNFWIKCIMVKINDILKENPQQNIVISDVRFQNEIDKLNEMTKMTTIKGYSIKVVRPTIQMIDEHESEKNIDKLAGVNYEIINDSTKNKLYDKIDKLMEEKILNNNKFGFACSH
ncbi:MAG: deoxynucleoside monophosphate kinase [Edafosvirus sp.]|uniref:Deoxynucleoside monophosphate kinase n=1 Tax=Edafosvirus sp. TaxID=2487765 RepID=A0A3G4ZTJ8_9VIRU|nr:MAG: deoxynucleoside monophosphate kinase [Edafosvirus sp.]